MVTKTYVCNQIGWGRLSRLKQQSQNIAPAEYIDSGYSIFDGYQPKTGHQLSLGAKKRKTQAMSGIG